MSSNPFEIDFMLSIEFQFFHNFVFLCVLWQKITNFFFGYMTRDILPILILYFTWCRYAYGMECQWVVRCHQFYIWYTNFYPKKLHRPFDALYYLLIPGSCLTLPAEEKKETRRHDGDFVGENFVNLDYGDSERLICFLYYIYKKRKSG